MHYIYNPAFPTIMRYTAASCVDVLQGEQEGILWMGN